MDLNSKSENTEIVEQVMLQLFELGVIKFGDFTLKSGIKSPIYIDLRMIVSYPSLLSKISELMYEKISKLNYDIICGVPYTALPIATCISTKHNQPMVMKRKEVKTYGTKKCVEGVFKDGQTCLIVEDLVTSGTSIIETVAELKKVGLKVNDSIVLIDREQGGKQNLANNNINLHSCYTITQMLSLLKKNSKINQETIDKVKNFLNKNQTVNIKKAYKRVKYSERAKLCKNKILSKLYNIMETKKTNLCISIDLLTCNEIIRVIQECGPYVCMVKTHVDIIKDFDKQFLIVLKKLSAEYNFLIFEDRKFADIGNTVINQFKNGIYNISDWCHITNCHILPGPGIIDGLQQVSLKKEEEKDEVVNHGLLLLAQMSSKDNCLSEEYTKKCIEYAKKYEKFVIGFISMENITPDNPTFVHMTPGVNLETKGDNVGQQYTTPDVVIGEKNSDVLIVGRGVYKSSDPKKAAMLYRDAGWNAYLKSLKGV